MNDQCTAHAAVVGTQQPDPLAADFDRENLAGLRRSVADYARMHTLTEDAIGTFVLAVNEILANAIVHGGGSGSLRLWCSKDALHCRISDEGPGIRPDRIGPRDLPPSMAVDGRGLWLARQFCTVNICAGPTGTIVDLIASLRSDGAIAMCPV
jgi:anti-sigma regulatory factor (Ser/Thr protein kinase)